MKKLFYSFLFLSFSQLQSNAQPVYPERLKVYIDCYSHCDMTLIRSEINIVDFLLDRQAADIHVLITDQNTGNGGDEYQLIFFGQNQFKNIKDTLRFINEPNNTRFEETRLLVKFLELGLTPYIARTKMAYAIQIEMKTNELDTGTTEFKETLTKDPWNYWVFRISANGRMNLEEVYKESRYSGRLSANRVTEEINVGFELEGGKNKSKFEYEDDNGVIQKIINRNDNFNLSHHLVKSINQHWSFGYETQMSRSTFSNNKLRSSFKTGVEYNIFPYKLVNTKSFTIAYLADIRRNTYLDTTIYDKLKETLWGHGVEANLSVNQKWGNIRFGADYHGYLHDFKLFNLEMNVSLNIRITGGLSFNIHTSAELIRDQIYLPKAGATTQEVLTRRRQLASGYNFSTEFGISYRFGSKLNNFVNPRFGGSN